MFRFRKSIDSIVADITQKIEHLHIVAEAHMTEAAVQNAIVDEATKAAAFAKAEYARAKGIAERLTNLIQG